MSAPSSRYRILSSQGKGGMGEVFLADDTQLERKVAIKFLPDELQHDPGASDSEESTAGNLTRTGTLLGTPAYMAPEQVRGESVDARSDIFSFGVVLFELLTGEHPFKRGSVSDTIAAILRDAPTRADGRGDQVDYAIFDKLLAKTPDDRYQSFDEVSVEVRRLRDATSAWTEPLSELADASETPLGGRRTPFVGRDDERAELGRWLDRAGGAAAPWCWSAASRVSARPAWSSSCSSWPESVVV